MTNEEIRDELVEEMKAFFESDVIDDPKKLCQFVNQKIGPYIESLNQKDLLEAFEKLDKIAGELPFFVLGDNLSLEVKKNRLLYFVQETIDFILPVIQIGIRINDFSKMEIAQEGKELIKLFGISDFNLLNAYVREWETLYTLLVGPAYSNLLKKKLVQEKKGKKFHIEILKGFFEKDNELKPLSFMMDFLDADLRNSIVHLEFFIDKEEDRLYYYNRKYRPEPISIEISELCMKVIMLYVIRLLTGILICKKMV